MGTQDRAERGNRETNPDTEFRRYDACAHLEWVLSLPEFRALLAGLRGEGMAIRKEGLPLREYAIDAIEQPGRDPVKRSLGMIRNRLQGVLPTGFGGAAGLLVRNPDVPLVIKPGRALAAERVGKLQEDCLELLRIPYRVPARDQRALDARRKRIKRALEVIRPLEPVRSWAVHDRSLELGVGSGVNVSATGFGSGSQIAVPSAARYPEIGRVAAVERERLLIDPIRVPERFSFYRGS